MLEDSEDSKVVACNFDAGDRRVRVMVVVVDDGDENVQAGTHVTVLVCDKGEHAIEHKQSFTGADASRVSFAAGQFVGEVIKAIEAMA